MGVSPMFLKEHAETAMLLKNHIHSFHLGSVL
jgi:hypothetical protein